MIKKLHLLAALITFASAVSAQNVGIGTNLPSSSAKLQIDDANRGILIPRVSLNAVNNGTTPVAAPVTGLLVFNTNAAVTGGDGAGFYFWNGTQWTPLKGGDNTLDMAYDEGGPGAGRIITADAGRVEINGTGGLLVNANTATISEAALINNTNGTQNTLTQLGYVGVNAGSTAVFGLRTIARGTAATGLWDGPMGVFGAVEAPTAGGTINLNATVGSANKALGVFGTVLTNTNITGSAQDMVAGVLGYTGLHNSGGGTVTGSRLYGGLFGGNGRVLGLWGENSAYMEFMPGWQVQNYETAAMGFYNSDPNGGNNGANIGTGDSYFSIETNITNTTSKNLVMQTRSRGNVGIGTAAPLDRLHVSDPTTPNAATVRISGLSTTTTLTSTATDVLVMADANGSLRRASELVKDAWYTTGNATTALRSIGTTTNQPFQFISNNIARGRISPTDGEFVWGAIASPYAGDALCAVGTVGTPFGINGYSAQNGSGTWGEILAASTTNFSAVQGVYAGSGVGAGAMGNYAGSNTSLTRAGVYGTVTQTTANPGGAGVHGYNSLASGNQRMGVLGTYNGTAYGIGVHGIGFGGGIMAGANDVAVVGWRANNANYSGYFNGNHVIANGTKSASVPTTKGNQLLYCMESPEVWFEDFGHANLVNGIAEVSLDPLYLETILIDDEHPMHVFVQVQGDCEDVYVIPGKTGFTVKEKNGGTSNVRFSYRLVAKRLHFPDHRFGNDPVWGPGDTRQYSERAPKRPLDYNEMVKQDEEAKKNWKPTPSPAITYPDIPKQELTRNPETKLK